MPGIRDGIFGSLCLVLLVCGSLPAEEVFSVRRSDETGIVVDFMLPPYTVDEQPHGGETFHRIRGGGALSGEESGFPELEMFPGWIGIPPGGHVEAVVTSRKTEVLDGLRILPATGDPSDQPSYSPEFLRSGLFPSRFLEVGEPGFLRRQQVVGFRLHPFQVDPVTNGVTITERATIEFRFVGGDREAWGGMAMEEGFEGVYRGSLLNYEPARAWRTRSSQSRLQSPSPFFDGEWWLKVVVTDEGMYRIRYEDILSTGLDPASIDPSTFQLFYGGGRELPWGVTDPRPELEEVAIEVTGTGDGRFNSGDEVIFYGQALLRWEPYNTYLRHRYDDDNCYWLTWGDPAATPLRMSGIDGSPIGTGIEIESYRNNKHVEQDHIYSTEEFVFREVPDDWVWDNIPGTEGGTVSRSYSFQLDDLAAGGEDSLRVEIYGQPSTGFRSVEIRMNGIDVRDVSFNGATFYNTGWFPIPTDLLTTGSNTLSLSLTGDGIYMGWFEINALYSMENAGDGLIFNGQFGSDTYRYRLGNASAGNPMIYWVADPFNPSPVENFAVSGSDIIFELSGSPTPDRFVYLDEGDLRQPKSISVIDDLTLRSTGNGADYLVITAPELEKEANEIAMYRAGQNGFLTMVVTSDRIYNEFAWGISDVTAFRDFLKYTFESWAINPAMVLFLGDGHYDYKEFTSAGRNKFNPLPPHINEDLVIEDWFVRFDGDPNPDMIYGRIPVRTTQEARIAVEKILHYETEPEFGSWKSRTILVADDYYTESKRCEGLPHTEQTESIDVRLPAAMERVKIYMLEYPFDPPETGQEKPDVTDDIVKEWNRGALLINFVGHGSYRTWAHEKAYHQPDDFSKLDNGARLPMIIAASCEIGRFDDPSFDGMIEEMLKTQGKGAVASFSATRATFSSPNERINNNLIEELFRDPIESPYLGEAAITAKIRTGGSNSYRYTLFGDPATRLALPATEVTFTDFPDSLRPLGMVALSGEIRSNGAPDESVDGFAEVKAFDSPVRKVFDECPSSQSFMTSGNPVFNGVVSVNEGRFTATFRVPSNVPASLPPDTSFLKNARIFTYLNWTGSDGYGAIDSIPVSLVAEAIDDTVPPTIRLTSNGRELVGGEALSVGQEILVEIYDESGINITGSPGHQILAEIDAGAVRENVTDAFRYDVDSFRGGSVSYTVPALEAGNHVFEFRASDNTLNIAHREIILDIFTESEVKLSEVLIYPNPFEDRCHFTFEVSQPSEITIRIYTVAGRLIRRLERSVGAGYNQVEWDGRDWNGDKPANGVYLCHVLARSFSGTSGTMREDEQLVKALLVR